VTMENDFVEGAFFGGSRGRNGWRPRVMLRRIGGVIRDGLYQDGARD
jgi:hypothetical protein